MFQTVRELFMNVVKHSGASLVRVSIKKKNNAMEVAIEDDGVGFDISKIDRNTFGFFSIRERLKHFGGSFFIDSEPGHGTRVLLIAPVNTDQIGKENL
jgi:signal transduction histidine kinase